MNIFTRRTLILICQNKIPNSTAFISTFHLIEPRWNDGIPIIVLLKFSCSFFKRFWKEIIIWPKSYLSFTEMPTATEYINQYFKLKIFIFMNRRFLWNILTSILNWKCLSCWIAKFYQNSAIQHDKHFHFKILVNVFRSGWHLCMISFLGESRTKFWRR